MLAMWTKGPWEREAGDGSGAGGPDGGLCGIPWTSFMAPGTELGAQNTAVSNTEGVPSGTASPRGREGLDQHFRDALGGEDEGR